MNIHKKISNDITKVIAKRNKLAIKKDKLVDNFDDATQKLVDKHSKVQELLNFAKEKASDRFNSLMHDIGELRTNIEMNTKTDK